MVTATSAAVVGVVVTTATIVTQGATTGAAVAATGITKVGCVLNVGLLMCAYLTELNY